MNINKHNAILIAMPVAATIVALAYVLSILIKPVSSVAEEILFEGLPSKDDTAIESARIISNKDGKFLRVHYRQGITYPDIEIPVRVIRQIGEFEFERLDTHEKYYLIPGTHYGDELYICNLCVSKPNNIGLPLLWGKES